MNSRNHKYALLLVAAVAITATGAMSQAYAQQVTDGIVDTAEDLREKPPYDAPLKAVQVEIRVQEPKSGKVRSVKVRKFLGKR